MTLHYTEGGRLTIELELSNPEERALFLFREHEPYEEGRRVLELVFEPSLAKNIVNFGSFLEDK